MGVDIYSKIGYNVFAAENRLKINKGVDDKMSMDTAILVTTRINKYAREQCYGKWVAEEQEDSVVLHT